MGPASRPKRIVLVRHGESQGNVDDTIYETDPDHALSLTPRGRQQAAETGARLRAYLGGEPITMYASPYVRVGETIEALDLGVPVDEIRVEPRLREQDWANFQDPVDIAAQRKLRDEYGHFYYRFTHGESGSDVYDRVSTFLESLWRSFDTQDMADENLVIVTHGLTMRLFCMRWFHWSVDYFEALNNPENGDYVVLERQPDLRYRLEKPFVQWDDRYTPTTRERSSWR